MTLLRKHDSLPGEHSTDHRQETAQRLLDSSARLSYNPELEIDWDAPLVDGKYGMTPEWCSLYGTDLWERMSEDQRITLTEHEAASIAGTGIWFEMILMQMLVRDLYRHDPATPYVQFGLTEIADECRHSIMFARSAQRYGIPSYRPKRWIRETGRLFKAVARGALAYGGTLFAEEILDMMQRDFMRDERVQPITRTVSHVHVVEESRHIRYAREETRRRSARLGRLERAWIRIHLGVSAYFVVTSLVNDQVYAAAGLDVAEAKKAARENRHYHDKLRQGTRRTVEFLDEVGLIGGPSTLLLRRAHVL
ncbi:P-aminobenzoate N-oxygenase AurF [Rhodococcus rhodochrous J3]|uniref:Diiron oxygenase n=2 Tax=Rhodococcus rhodochrous TaxID=1829 RepID=A0AA46WTD7_RHORH|nr:diiron oxygenase [Rhodococcus rhodochrous]MCB8909783.1 diiron oxygenase [Rhodococcus rhodochrous]MDJ0399999.1 diiron oxygenase [Rhodococcus rhodochrous]MDO1485229.1 diiron oxygenase [Rhodococcus rhodochrous]UZF44021.1 diiron oxygenase [Rhodococcus rhodochrous]SMG47428.1 P-aminobenzoate N-oxygenase AurF [Rhodococcus rhodochrous J3]